MPTWKRRSFRRLEFGSYVRAQSGDSNVLMIALLDVTMPTFWWLNYNLFGKSSGLVPVLIVAAPRISCRFCWFIWKHVWLIARAGCVGELLVGPWHTRARQVEQLMAPESIIISVPYTRPQRSSPARERHVVRNGGDKAPCQEIWQTGKVFLKARRRDKNLSLSPWNCCSGIPWAPYF